MRIRSIRPEFWSSEDVAAMDWHTRLVFIGLWSYVDDNGVGRDVEPLIVAALFPLDGDLPESSRRVTGALRHLSDHGQITRYRIGGKAYLFINAWKKHQRIEKASAGRYPLPTSEDAEIVEPSPRAPGILPEPSTPGEGEKGRRGEGDSSDESDARIDPFLEFWKNYPRKTQKRDAEKAYRRALTRASADAILDGLKRYKFDPEQRYQPQAERWLNGDRWEDAAVQEAAPLFDVDKLPEPGQGWSTEQLDMVLGKDAWSVPEPPEDMDDDAGYLWQQQQQRRHFAQRVQAALKAIGRAA